MLSAHATPFVPLTYEPVELAIFNDGVPAMVPTDKHEVVHNIPDEAIDEIFPPTAEEAAELEIVEHYVSLMARLDLMEELEEAARNDHTGFLKRWEARRELSGRPRQARHSVSHVDHGKRPSIQRDITDGIVVHDQSHLELENRLRAREYSKSGGLRQGKAAFKTKLQAPHHRRASNTIQQPRK
uniref:Uncharacterized protein n=1 Tax=Craspedostauros australis TaxID=1486917 RepID=A0A6T6G227_9STRA|mmetsp:Transcript_21329/g.59264  ORF Transcript_21329/g.59264 Transcript_21329/m.59264 type:complete len:184 (+) Transcript_21329:489-1040(+)